MLLLLRIMLPHISRIGLKRLLQLLRIRSGGNQRRTSRQPSGAWKTLLRVAKPHREILRQFTA